MKTLIFALTALVALIGVASACPLFPADENCDRLEQIEHNQRILQIDMDALKRQQADDEMYSGLERSYMRSRY